jgi:hypothetical protein
VLQQKLLLSSLMLTTTLQPSIPPAYVTSAFHNLVYFSSRTINSPVIVSVLLQAGRSIEVPVYDFTRHARSEEVRKVSPAAAAAGSRAAAAGDYWQHDSNLQQGSSGRLAAVAPVLLVQLSGQECVLLRRQQQQGNCC